jgi:hypothetical protein
MHIKQGLVPTILGTAVAAAGFALKDTIPKPYSGGMVGFGIANIVMGSAGMIGSMNSSHKLSNQFEKVLNTFK